jgi:hypothetical protein
MGERGAAVGHGRRLSGGWYVVAGIAVVLTTVQVTSWLHRGEGIATLTAPVPANCAAGARKPLPGDGERLTAQPAGVNPSHRTV